MAPKVTAVLLTTHGGLTPDDLCYLADRMNRKASEGKWTTVTIDGKEVYRVVDAKFQHGKIIGTLEPQ
jgi:hypothetical protein